MTRRSSRIDIGGMSCANCAATISDSLEELDGVLDQNVNYATDEATVEYDTDTVSLEEIYSSIDAAGYQSQRDRVTIGITDMSCANCATTNETALEQVPGVITADVNYATDEATIEFNSNDVSVKNLYTTIENAGYTPVRDHSERGNQQDVARRNEIRKHRRLLLVGTVFALPFIAFMIDTYFFNGAIFPDSFLGFEFGWLELFLATPVQLVLGWQFYRNSYTALIKNNRANMDVLIALGSTTAYVSVSLSCWDSSLAGYTSIPLY